VTITSAHNESLKEIRRLSRTSARAKAGRFVAEGEDLVAEAAAQGWEPVILLCAEGSDLPGTEVEQHLLDGVSALGSGTRTIGVYETRWGRAPTSAAALSLTLHGVGDPGNVGTIVRSALAFGVDDVVLAAGCADPFGPKAVRASMGAIFAMPVHRATDDDRQGHVTVALVGGQGVPLADLEHLGNANVDVMLLVGSERDGLPAEVVDRADFVAHIPIAFESLNAAMAATVALYEMTRAFGPSTHRIPAP
jgi:TrmH family RNA methyltransferase